jgi:hypothetical protein
LLCAHSLALGAELWRSWNEKWYKQFDLNFTGFIINGAAGTMTPAAEEIYSSFSPGGIVLTANIDPQGGANDGKVTAQGVPVMHHVSDLPGGDVKKATAVVVSIAKPRRPNVGGTKLALGAEHGTTSEDGADEDEVGATKLPQFMIFRTILQTAQFHDDVAVAASAAVPELVWVDPVTLGALVKVHAKAQE